MARYDRIARIDPPARGDAYDGWLTLRDLEGREREPELGRRARLRFLALRPVRRLLLRGLNGPDRGSFDRQLNAVREQLDQLPDRDPERLLLDRYLEELGGRSPEGLVRATLQVGAFAEAAGHRFAAEEFYRTALELAEAHGLDAQRVAGLRSLGRVQRDRQEWDEATATLESSAELARASGSTEEWARSREALAAVHLRRGHADPARDILDEIAAEAGPGDRGTVAAIAAAGRCALELAEGNPEEALEAGWRAATRLAATDEARNGVLLNMAAAFRRLGLADAATSCYDVVVRWAAWPEHRIEARLESALVAAEAGDSDAFAARRQAVLESLDGADRPLRALVDLGLGRGALVLNEPDQARDHLRDAIAAGRDMDDHRILSRSELLLTALEDGDHETPGHTDPSDHARSIAGRIVTLGNERVHS